MVNKVSIFTALALIAAVLLLIAGLRLTGNITKEDTIKIGGLFGLSGFSSEWGQADYNAALLAIEEKNKEGGINGKRIEFIVEDTKSDLASTSTAFTKLIEIDNVEAVIGPTWSEFAEVVIPIANQTKTVVITGSAGGELESFKNKYFFSTWPSVKLEMRTLAKYMSIKNYKKTALVYSQTAWAISVADSFTKESEFNQIAITKTETIRYRLSGYRI